MYLDYSKLEFDANGNPETPELLLETMSEDVIGVIPGVHNLRFNIKLSEPSEMSFDVPAVIDGEPNWIYDQLSGHKLVYTKHYGIYVLLNPTTESNGIAEAKHIQAYSIEKTLDTKRFFLEEGKPFKFYDQKNYMNGDTIMGRIFEIATGWRPGYVSPSVARQYRTFDQYDDYLLSFVYNTAPEKFRCVFVFDPYERTVSVYNADKPLCDETIPDDEENSVLPIYLDFDNLLNTVDVEEKSDELVTAIRPYGADDLDIRKVNPIGNNWMYDLSWFMRRDKDGKYIGDIPETLANKWESWQEEILSNRERYRGLSAMKASTTLDLLSEQAKLSDLKGELEGLEARQSVIIQAMAMDSAQQSELDSINKQIASKELDINAQQDVVDLCSASVEAANAEINDIVQALSITNYFEPEEYKTLSAYFSEQDITEETFVATDIDTGVSGQSYTLSDERVSIKDSQIVKVELTDFNKTIYTLTGGSFSLTANHLIRAGVTYLVKEDGTMAVRELTEGGPAQKAGVVAGDVIVAIDGTDLTAENRPELLTHLKGEPGTQVELTLLGPDGARRTATVILETIESTPAEYETPNGEIEGDIIRGTLEVKSDGNYVLSVDAGSIKANDTNASSGCITMAGVMTDPLDNIGPVTVGSITTQEGSSFGFSSASSSLYLTANASEYKKYSVGLELYDYAASVLKDLATPTYEFSVDSGNFIFADEFAPFRDKLELGKGIYLRLNHRSEPITPYIIEFELEFEDRSKFSIIFSNRFKRPDEVNTLKGMIEQSYSSSRSFDSSKYVYSQVANQQAAVTQFMNSSIDAAKNTILAAANQSVIINGAGINVGGDGQHQLRIVDKMIAMTDDNWAHAKLAIGLFKSNARCSPTEEIGEYWGVNAEVIGGKLIVGYTLVIENETDDGVMQFKVDATGAWLYNSRIVLQEQSKNGLILIDPKYGIVAGTSALLNVNGTTVTPQFMYEAGDLIFEKDTGMPENANFYLDSRTGNAYFRGTLMAERGEIGGYTIEKNFLHSGIGTNYVALNGSGGENSLYAMWAGDEDPARADFVVKRDGSIRARNGEFGDGTISASKFVGTCTGGANTWFEHIGIRVGTPLRGTTFEVDTEGNVTMKGNIILGGVITWASESFPVQSQFSVDGKANWHSDMRATDKWKRDMKWDGEWGTPYQFRGEDGAPGSDGDPAAYLRSIKITEISEDSIKSALIQGARIEGAAVYGANIYGGRIFAVGGDKAYACLEGSSMNFYYSGIANPKVKIDVGAGGLQPRIDLGAGDDTKRQIFSIYKNPTQGIISYIGQSNSSCGFAFQDDGTIFPLWNTKMSGTWDFSEASVIGVTATFG